LGFYVESFDGTLNVCSFSSSNGSFDDSSQGLKSFLYGRLFLNVKEKKAFEVSSSPENLLWADFPEKLPFSSRQKGLKVFETLEIFLQMIRKV